MKKSEKKGPDFRGTGLQGLCDNIRMFRIPNSSRSPILLFSRGNGQTFLIKCKRTTKNSCWRKENFIFSCMTFFQILAGKHGLAITQQNAKKQKQLTIDPKSIGHYMANHSVVVADSLHFWSFHDLGVQLFLWPTKGTADG